MTRGTRRRQLTSKSVQGLFAAIGLRYYRERSEADTTTRVRDGQLKELGPFARWPAYFEASRVIQNTQT